MMISGGIIGYPHSVMAGLDPAMRGEFRRSFGGGVGNGRDPR